MKFSSITLIICAFYFQRAMCMNCSVFSIVPKVLQDDAAFANIASENVENSTDGLCAAMKEYFAAAVNTNSKILQNERLSVYDYLGNKEISTEAENQSALHNVHTLLKAASEALKSLNLGSLEEDFLSTDRKEMSGCSFEMNFVRKYQGSTANDPKGTRLRVAQLALKACALRWKGYSFLEQVYSRKDERTLPKLDSVEIENNTRHKQVPRKFEKPRPILSQPATSPTIPKNSSENLKIAVNSLKYLDENATAWEDYLAALMNTRPSDSVKKRYKRYEKELHNLEVYIRWYLQNGVAAATVALDTSKFPSGRISNFCSTARKGSEYLQDHEVERFEQIEPTEEELEIVGAEEEEAINKFCRYQLKDGQTYQKALRPISANSLNAAETEHADAVESYNIAHTRASAAFPLTTLRKHRLDIKEVVPEIKHHFNRMKTTEKAVGLEEKNHNYVEVANNALKACAYRWARERILEERANTRHENLEVVLENLRSSAVDEPSELQLHNDKDGLDAAVDMVILLQLEKENKDRITNLRKNGKRLREVQSQRFGQSDAVRNEYNRSHAWFQHSTLCSFQHGDCIFSEVQDQIERETELHRDISVELCKLGISNPINPSSHIENIHAQSQKNENEDARLEILCLLYNHPDEFTSVVGKLHDQGLLETGFALKRQIIEKVQERLENPIVDHTVEDPPDPRGEPPPYVEPEGEQVTVYQLDVPTEDPPYVQEGMEREIVQQSRTFEPPPPYSPRAQPEVEK